PTVTTQAVSSIAATTATGNGNITNLGVPNPTAYGVCWNTTGTPTTSDSKVDKGAASATGAFTASMTSLTANTTYYVRAFATNTAGTSYGAEVSFTTSPIAPTVTTQAVSSIAATTATGNGNITNLGVPNPTAYGVCWNTTGTPTASDSKVDNGAASATGAFTASMTSLTQNTTYYVRAYATNTAGTSYGTEVSFTTLTINNAPTDIDLSASAIDENVAANSTVGTLSTTDPDAGDTFTYTLVAGSGSTDNASFNISVSSLRITASPDFETKSSYSVRVRTTDQGGLYYEKAFTISIIDQNDVVPVVTAGQNLSIDENLANGTSVGTLVATDGDVTPTIFQGWTIVSGNTGNAFVINPATGEITVANSAALDRETIDAFTLMVTVTDGVNTSAQMSVTISLNDLNDVAPVITAGQSFSVDENLANGTSVGTLVATDGDVTPTTFQGWAIVSGNTGNAFAINPSTGEITVANSAALDRETIDAFTLMVTVTDGVNTSAQQSVTISLNDLNDVAPVIAANQLFPVAELAANGTVVGTISATDGDVTPTTTFQSWTIVSGNTDGAFSLDASTGELTVANSAALDHNTNPIFSLSVSVSDGVNTSAAQTVTVTVGNLNVTAPVITADQSFSIDENSSNGTVVGTVQATDADPVPTTLQDWTITGGNTNNAFGIDASTGEITVTNTTALDRETTAEFTLTLTVSDGLNTSNPQTVTVTLNDVNDVTPIVTPDQSFSIDEKSPSGTVIGTVVATDGDVTPTTFQDWTISTNADPNGNTIPAFSIDPATGELAVNDPLDLVYETTPNFTIYVTVSDGVQTSLPEAVSIHLNNTTGIEEVTNGNVKAYPNPAINDLFVESTPGNIISIVTLTGETIYNGIIESTITTIDVSRFKQGMYILKVSGEKGTSTRMIVVE
ncbi:MAG TPA: cadherin domain-containing protein, partial [Williamwhitmania sp.]|nr:cadherin domain-containing protein [Williamwhitmania sp.]